MLDLGDAYPAALDVFDVNGVLTNAATVVLTISLPDGTTATPSVTNPPSVTGQYRVTYVPLLSGRYSVRWVTTNPNTGYTDAFDVAEQVPDQVVSLSEIKALLGIGANDTSVDNEIRAIMAGVTQSLEDYKNTKIVQATITDHYRIGAFQRMRLLTTPVISLTSVAAESPGTTTWSPANLYVEPDTGLVQVLTGPGITGRVVATYIAGWQVIPRQYIEAGKTLFQHLWEARRGPGGISGVIGAEELGDWRHYTGMPRKVTEMMGPPFPVVM